MKLLDIDNTIAKGVENVAKMGVSMLTLHAYPKAMRSAVEAAKGSDLCLLGVTVLTSMDDADLKEAGYSDTPEALVLKRAQQARDAGMGGIVASAAEAFAIRQAIGPDMAVVTRYSSGGSREGRPEAGHDTSRCVRSRCKPSRRCATNCRCKRSQGFSPCHSGRNALGCLIGF